MKKILVITALIMFCASSSFAAVSVSMDSALAKSNTGKTIYGATSGTATTSSPQIGKTSTGVGIGILCVATTGAGYSLVTQHMNGSKAFGTSYDSTSMYSIDVTTVGTAMKTVPTAITTADFAAWTAL